MKKWLLLLCTISISFGWAGDAETPEDHGSSYQSNKTPEDKGEIYSPGPDNAAVEGLNDLDAYIPVPVQKKYGLYYLPQQEKEQIAQWLDKYSKKAPSLEPSMLSLNIAGGQYIQLDDGSVWAINPNDQNISAGWLSPVKIVISRSQDSEYPFRLYNSATGNAVTARKIKMNAIQK